MTAIETKKVYMVFAPLTDDPSASDDDVGIGPFKDKDGVGAGLPGKDPLDDAPDADAESFEDLKEKEDGDDDLDELGLAQDDDYNAM